jgi:8-oxo-dGTP pyrophosphatase MutT (NUDIX family)
VATVVLLREDGSALMQHRDNKPGLSRAGMWCLPGGQLEPGEPSAAGARRELHEETGYDCRDLHFLAELPDVNEMTGEPYTLIVFWARYDGKQAIACHEGQAMQFLMRSEASSYAMPEIVLRAWDLALAFSGPSSPGEVGQKPGRVAGVDGSQLICEGESANANDHP